MVIGKCALGRGRNDTGRGLIRGITRGLIVFAGALMVAFWSARINQPVSPSSALSSLDPDDPTNFTMNPAVDIPACAGQTECFAFTIDTRITTDGAVDVSQAADFDLPTKGKARKPYVTTSYDWIVDWGDGITDTLTGSANSSTPQIHTYAAHGEYQITIRPSNAVPSQGWFNAFGLGHSHTLTVNAAKLISINTPFSNLARTTSTAMFSEVFYGSCNLVGIPAQLFANTNTSSVTDFGQMFDSAFYNAAYNRSSATIPAGLFDSINTSLGTNFGSMFRSTFSCYASSSSGIIPAGLFDSIDTGQGTSFDSMFFNTFYFYSQRTAVFIDTNDNSVVTSNSFRNIYSTKDGPTGTPSDNPTVTPTSHIIPTYTTYTRTITAPSGNYIWFTTDGTSCAVASPTPDCSPQDQSTFVTFPSSTYWTPTTSTEVGNVTFYSGEASIDLAISGPINLSIMPTSSGTSASGSHDVTVSTWDPYGYRLTLAIAPSSGDTCTATNSLIGPASSTIPSTTNPWVTNGLATTPLATNTWGFNLNSSAANFMSIPDCSSPRTIKETTAATDSAGDTTTVTYGAKVDIGKPSGDYQAILIYTAIGK
jgi:hypothetical protein